MRSPGLSSVMIVCELVCLTSGAHAVAVPGVRQKPALAYMAPPKVARRFEVERVAGEVVFTPPQTKTALFAEGIRLALFDAQQRRVADTISGERGRFDFPALPSGSYTLVAGEESLHMLSVPLQIRSGTSRNGNVSALLLRMRAREDRQQSGAAEITNNTLRLELLDRIAKDQAIRNALIQRGADHPDKTIAARMQQIDAENLARMKEIVRKYRWLHSAQVGFDGAEAAFLLVQHAPLDFQKAMLPQVRNAYRAGDLSGNNYALLLDRVLVGEGKRQIYGTQTRPLSEWNSREPVLFPIEDVALVDQRRAEAGMMPLADYLKMLKAMYFPPDREKP